MLRVVAVLMVPALFWGGLIVIWFSLVHGLLMMAAAILFMQVIDKAFGWRK